ncbi:MAG TPA: hypothetical protein ENG63_03485 [Candidatus Desulfofervidus auxilii]|uniref:Uncharacterized protein n=1 Tax=Desulfofervidus auxilii TaxID=1621989 RepID=A0A7C0Y4U1_DESA2|nr:hypothetical protein [Candidatus Desulfofervidus auxilii]
MKHEPLNNKIFYLPEKNLKIFLFSSVKSAVLGFLEDIRKHTFFCERDTDFYVSLDDIEKLLKKWFKDVI